MEAIAVKIPDSSFVIVQKTKNRVYKNALQQKVVLLNVSFKNHFKIQVFHD